MRVSFRFGMGVVLLLAAAVVVGANHTQSERADSEYTLSDIIRILEAQGAELAQQRKLIESQNGEIARLRDELDAVRGEPAPASLRAESEPDAVGRDSDQPPAASPASADTRIVDAEQKREKKRAKAQETTDKVEEAQRDDPTKALLEDFVGGFRLPGTKAALRIGGFVRTTVVDSLDPLETTDRFIVGSIPTDNQVVTAEAQAAITANQSRLNVDLREPTNNGILRAFIEGDFFGGDNNNQFRLRHAFGQWKRVLAGQTWSAFMDTDASPEEVDFEGLNGRINVRQPQVRIFPRLGAQYQLELSAEDPNPQVTNGDGVTRFPDLIATGRVNWGPRWHFKVGGLYRQVRANWTGSPGSTDKETGWGATVSGRVEVDWFDDRDSILFQINGGKGIGRYINDLSSVGNFDGIFDDAGNLELIDVLAGYVSGQHWWGATMRSNLTFGYVWLDNPDFVEDDFYKKTYRVSTNLLWSPTPRVTLGGELLWGQRENEDGSDGDARQVQFTARYSF